MPGCCGLNIHLLFWMSLIPFVTAYMGDTHGSPLSVALYGGVLALASTAFAILRSVLIKHHPNNADITAHHRRVQRKNLVSLLTLCQLSASCICLDLGIASHFRSDSAALLPAGV